MRRLVFLLCIVLLGCHKNKAVVKCYVCEMQYANGDAAGTQYPCTSDLKTWQQEQKDNYGRPMSSTCKEQ